MSKSQPPTPTLFSAPGTFYLKNIDEFGRRSYIQVARQRARGSADSFHSNLISRQTPTAAPRQPLAKLNMPPARSMHTAAAAAAAAAKLLRVAVRR